MTCSLSELQKDIINTQNINNTVVSYKLKSLNKKLYTIIEKEIDYTSLKDACSKGYLFYFTQININKRFNN
jgi:hypothetical protein